ncbi:MAG: glycosyl hydrolase family 18 protein [Lachnospiraceae bacterium]|nr:glycosyl hydrolase family 18 protein [Lachnospiraceae bacterium]
MAVYVVKADDSVETIAAAAGVSVEQLVSENQIPYPYRLAIGQALYLPAEMTVPGREINTNGYAYPFIGNYVLRRTLPYLSSLSVFSYGFTTAGELVPPRLPDVWMIQAAEEYGTEAILTLTPLDEAGQFNNYLIHAVVQNPESRRSLEENLLAEVREKGYAGVDVDFEYILAEDRDAFSLFVKELTEAMHGEGRTVSVALAPKTSANQPGLLYEGKDYAALGAAADRVLLMTYEWGYKYSEPMAVAPLPQVRQVVEYAVTEIDPAKILLGMPNYGYDWPLPYVPGETAARTIGNVEAVQIAIENGAEIRFDETAQSPWFSYESGGIAHEVWFEDVRSVQAKCDLIRASSLRGAGIWQINQLFLAGWLQLEENFHVLRKKQ